MPAISTTTPDQFKASEDSYEKYRGSWKRHGLSHTRIYRIYHGIIKRCYNKNSEGYWDYGGRGIAMCDRWLLGENGQTGLECFVQDMGQPPTQKHSVDRYPNYAGNYDPSNCRWATSKEQEENKPPRDLLMVNVAGKRISRRHAADILGVDYSTISWRHIRYGDSLGLTDCGVAQPRLRDKVQKDRPKTILIYHQGRRVGREEAASILGISMSCLKFRMKKYRKDSGVSPDEKRSMDLSIIAAEPPHGGWGVTRQKRTKRYVRPRAARAPGCQPSPLS